MQNDIPRMKAELRLILVPGIGPRLRGRLLEHFGSAEAVFRASRAQLQEVQDIGEKLSRAIYDAVEGIDVDAELETYRKLGIRTVFLQDPEYPSLLKQIFDPPGVLFVRGTLRPEDSVALAVVGTRHATPYGQRQTRRLVGEFVRANFSIISGLARGIDAHAHRAALEAGGRTVAVLGHGLGVDIYPPENRGLAEQILEAGGALVSEFSPYTAPSTSTFPQRNRIISGMSLGTVVVEAGARSGASITAKSAAEQGREVFAVPGPVDSSASMGCHALIRDGAKLLASVEDILEELPDMHTLLPDIFSGGFAPAAPSAAASSPAKKAAKTSVRPAELQLSAQEKQVFGEIPPDGCTVDQLAQATGLPIHNLMTTLTMLEVKRLVKRAGGQRVFKA